MVKTKCKLDFMDKAATPQNIVHYFFQKNVSTDFILSIISWFSVLVTYCGHLKVQEISKRYPNSNNGMTTIYDTDSPIETISNHGSNKFSTKPKTCHKI